MSSAIYTMSNSNGNIIIYILIPQSTTMSHIYIGTSYNQVYSVPLNLKQPIIKLGQKKKSSVVGIYVSEQEKQLQYANQMQSYHIDSSSNQTTFSQYLPKQEDDNKRIIEYEEIGGQRYFCTNHGEIYYREIESQSQQELKLHKLFYNQTYENAIKSLPPQRAGKLLPEYTRARVSFSQHGSSYVAGFVGRGVLPFVYSFDKFSIIWKAKNVTNDYLDLQIPPNDVDLCFLNNNFHMVAAHADNKIRIYDVNGRRRKPISDFTLNQVIKADKVHLTRIVKSPCEKYLYMGNHKGSVYELDIRKNYAVSGKFKGITTTIKDLQVHKEHLAVVSLDGYLRIFNTQTKQKQFERYLNAHPEVIKIGEQGIQFAQQQLYKVQQMNLNEQNEEQKQGDQSKQPNKVKKIRKRNKVGLKYLQPRPFDAEIKLEQNQQQEAEEKSEMKQQKNRGVDYDEDLDL